MQSKRPVFLGLIVLVLAAIGLWLFAKGAEPPTPAVGVEEQPADGSGDGGGMAATRPAPAADGAARVAVTTGGGSDVGKPALVGRVVGPDGRPIAGARVSVASGLGLPGTNGQFDPQSFEPGDLEELAGGGFDPRGLLRSVREQLADRVEAETDAEGRFRVVAKGTSRGVGLRVLARGHGILDRRCDRPREQDVDVGMLTLQAAAIVAGRVLTPGGAPIAGARVGRVFEAEQRWMGGLELDIPELGEIETLRRGEGVVTDDLGQFELAHVAPGELTLRARHAEHPTTKSPPMTVQAGQHLPSVVLTMPAGGVIAGVVNGLPADAKDLQVMAARKPKADTSDPAGRGGMAGLLGNLGLDLDAMTGETGIGLPERTCAIGAGGRFELRGLQPDTWRVWVARTGGRLAGSTVCSERIEAMPGSTVQLLFEPGVTVTFTVVDAKSGAPVERMTVRDRLAGGGNGGAGGIADVLGGIAARGGLQPRRPASYPNGKVTVANLRPKTNQKLTLTIEALGYATLERRDLELPRAGNLDLGALKLEPVPLLQVTVVAAEDGRPVPGASVRLVGAGAGNGPGNGNDTGAGMRGMLRELRRSGAGGNIGGLASGRTDGDGRMTFNRPQQAATIEVEARGFAPFTSESIALTAQGPDAYTARLGLGGAVAVTVCDPAGKPAPGALVEHRSPDGDVDGRKVDGQGVARFEHLTPGAHQFRLGTTAGGLGRIAARFGGRGSVGGNATPGEDGPPWQPVLVADQATATLRLVKQPTATLRGTVRENGLPLEGARVAFRDGPATGGGEPRGNALADMAEQFLGGPARGGAGRSPHTDAQGAFHLRELPEGEHHLRITHKSRTMPATVRVVLGPGENVLDVQLDMTTLRGRVKDSEGKPVGGARIRVGRPRTGADANEIGEAMQGLAPGLNLGGGGTITTDASGVFEVRGIDPDVELELQASAKGFAPAVARVTAARGATTAAPDLVLGASGTVRVSVAGNQPLGAVRARWVGQGEEVASVLGVLRRGKGTLEGLRPGTWEVSLESLESLGGRLGGRFGGGQGGQQQPAAQPQQKRTVEVIAGQTVDVDL